MSTGELADPREIWDGRFSRAMRRGVRHNYEPWLERWASILRASGNLPILDLGCGSGFDSRYLLSRDFRVISADFSRESLCVARRIAEQAEMVEMDLRGGMPFPEEAFQVIIANLCLHYFRWQQTQAILERVRGRLRVGGHLLARVNSTRDHYHGAVDHEMVERRCYIVGGILKRFFDREDLRRLFETGWMVRGLEEQVIHCYRKPKVVWEVVAEKSEGSA